MSVIVVFSTFPSEDKAADIARTLVSEGLAACANLVPPVRSIYRWQGELHDDREARVALHTRRSLVAAIAERTQELHPYDIPCVIALSLAGGSPAYLRWILEETREP